MARASRADGIARRKAGAPPGFTWIRTDDGNEADYVHLARELWIEWANQLRDDVNARGKERTRARGSGGRRASGADDATVKARVALIHPDALRCVEQICHAQDPAELLYPAQWGETLDITLRGFLGRQPGERRDLGIELPDFLFGPTWQSRPKHGPWHWLMIGDSLAGAIGADGLNDVERDAALRRLMGDIGDPDDQSPIDQLITNLAEVAAGPPKMGIRATIVLSRLSLHSGIRRRIRRQVSSSGTMFRLFRSFTTMLADTTTDPEPARSRSRKSRTLAKAVAAQNAALAHELLEIDAPVAPYRARSLEVEMVATLYHARFGEARTSAGERLLRLVRDPEATWRERAYAGEVLTRPTLGSPASVRAALDECLQCWDPDVAGNGSSGQALGHAAAVLVERSLVGQGLKRSVGTKVVQPPNPRRRMAKAATPSLAEVSTDEVIKLASARYSGDHWIHGALQQEAVLRDPIYSRLRIETDQLADDLLRGRGGTADYTVWHHPYNGISARARFLCEEAVLSVGGTRRRRSVDCLAVSGLGGFASDTLLKALVQAEDAVPLWTQVLAAWSVGYLRQPTKPRLEILAQVAHRHLDEAEQLSVDAASCYDRLEVIHALIWAIGDSAGSEQIGYRLVSDRTTLVSKLLYRALDYPVHQDHFRQVRQAAAYTLRYCDPGSDLPSPVDSDPVVQDYAKMRFDHYS